MSDRFSKFAEIYNNIIEYPTLADVAAELDRSVQTVKNTASNIRYRKSLGESVPDLISRKGKAAKIVSEDPNAELAIADLPDYEEPIEDLIQRARDYNEGYASYMDAKKIVDVEVNYDGPIGVVGLPDPHLDNPGCMLGLALDQAEVIADTPGLYAVGIGDWIDNFIVGRLERARRENIMRHSDSWRILEFYMDILAPKLVAVISGNHLDWTTQMGGVDVFKKMCKDLGLAGIYDPDEVRVRLKTPSGKDFIHLARHKYKGSSKYNPAHGITLWMMERWAGEDVFWGGHIHTSAHISMEREFMGGSKNVRGIQLAAYKDIDKYARQEGFRRNVPFVAPLVIHDPESGKTHFFEDFDQGVEVLKYMQDQYSSKKAYANAA